MKQKNNITLLVIGVLTLLVAIVGAAYAYFSSSITPGSGLNLDVEAQANTAQFTASGGQFGFTVTGAEMQQANAGGLAKEATGSINVSLTSPKLAMCTFDVMFAWNSGSSYTATSGRGSQFEFGVLYEGSAYGATNNAKSPVNFDTLLSTYNGVVLKGAKVAILESDGTNKTSNITLNFKVQMYNLNHDQSALAGSSSKTYSGRFYVTNVDCLENRLYLSDAVLAMESNSDYISSQDDSIYRVVNQNGVRYEGADPDNYVYYNCANNNDTSTCERWRIIGTFDGSEIGLTPGKKYTKIASRPLAPSEINWDSMFVLDGGVEVINFISGFLSVEYLNSLSSTAQAMIAKENNTYSKWYLLGPDDSTSQELYSQEWYLYERNTSYGKPGYKDGVQYGALGETNAAIGLMYPSDYGYAAYGTNCDNETSMTLFNYKDGCASVDWLFYMNILTNSNGTDIYEEYLISPNVEDFYGALYVMRHGRVANDLSYIDDAVARPVLYLGTNVRVEGGSGTYESPYILSLN